MAGKDVWRVGPEIPTVIPAHLRPRQFRAIFTQFRSRFPPGEVSVALGEPHLAEHLHHPRFRESFGEEKHLGVALLHFADELLPEGHRLGVRIVHSEDFHAFVHPEEHDVDELTPEVLPVSTVEIQRIDVLILFRRIFRVSDRAIGPLVKPIGMRGDIRVIGRAVECVVEGDL